MADRAKRLEKLVWEALGQPLEEGRRFLEQACADDPELLAEALAFIDPEDDLSRFLEQPPFESMVARAQEDDTTLDGRIRDDGELTEAAPGAALSDPEPSSDSKSWNAWQDTAERPWEEILGRSQLGPYKILGSAGSGGMGHVYIAEDPRLGRKIALKTLSLEHSVQATWLRRFEKEARILAAINHPNIVTIHSIEEADGIRFLTMELVDGETLSKTLPAEGLPFDRLLSIAVELAGALESAHERGVIHRDLKPANVMITRDGRVKILDFGIAKTDDIGPQIAQTKGVVGTVAYMSPEQVGNEPLDGRSDLFSLGVVLYQLATGEHPFPAPSPIFRIKSILNDRQLPVRELRPDIPEAFAQIVERLLKKDPAERFQNAAELSAALAKVADERRTESLLETRKDLLIPPNRGAEAIGAALGILLVFLAIATGMWWQAEHGRPSAEAVAQQGRTRLAVLFFNNLSRDAELEWLSAGIPELLITDLAQSPELNVLSAGLIHRIIKQSRGAGEDENPSDMTQTVARQAEAQAVVNGSFVRLGEKLRVSYTIESPDSGEILLSEALEESGETALFALVDRMSASILDSLQATRPEQVAGTVSDATTSSISAWQAFAEAQSHLYRANLEQAVDSFEDAIDIDPGFATAWAELSVVHLNLGRIEESQAASRKAFELSDRLPVGVKLGIEAKYYGATWSNTGRAIETYRIGLGLFPENNSWRNNLARRYSFFERYSEANEEFDRLIAGQTDFLGTYTNAATARAALGDFESGFRWLTDLSERSDGWLVRAWLGFLLTEWGKLDEAGAELDRAAELNSETHFVPYARWRLAVLEEDWDRARSETSRILVFEDPHARWRGHVSAARNALYRGQSEALDHFQRAIDESTGSDRALARCFRAELLLELERYEEALEEARAAQEEGKDQWPELRGIYFAALAEQGLGREARADELATDLRERWRRQPNSVEERQMLHLQGRLMLARGDYEAAVRLLDRAAALLPPRGIEVHWHVFPDHVPIWADLGRAEMVSGRPDRAKLWLQRVVESGSEHLEQPLAYVASFYRLGLSQHRLGESEEALRSFEHFWGFWGGGDLYPQWLTEAAAAIEPTG